jgi:hypothetical protein
VTEALNREQAFARYQELKRKQQFARYQELKQKQAGAQPQKDGFLNQVGRAAVAVPKQLASQALSVPKGLAKGAIGTAVDLVNIAPMAGNILPGEQGIRPISEEPFLGSDDIQRRFEGAFGDLARPQSDTQRVTDAITEGVGSALIPAGVLARANKPVAAAAETLAGAVGAGTAEVVEGMGGGPVGSAVAGIAAGIGAPLAATRQARRFADRTVPQGENISYTTGIPMTRAEQNQDFEGLAFQEAVRKRTKGARAGEALDEFGLRQQAAVRGAMNDITGRPLPDSPQEPVGQAVGVIRQQGQRAKEGAEKTFEQAVNQGERSFLKQEAYRDGLLPQLESITKKFRSVPRINDTLRELESKFSQRPALSNIPVSLGGRPPFMADIRQLNDWRSNITEESSQAFAAGRDRKGAALAQMREAFDDFIITKVDEGMIMGDDVAPKIYRNAIRRWKNYEDLYTADKVVNRLVSQNNLTSEEALNLVIGSGKIGNKATGRRIVVNVLNAAGEQREAVRQQLKDAYLARALRRATVDNAEQGEGVADTISMQKLKNEINSLLMDNPSLTGVLFDSTERVGLRSLRNDLSKIATRPAGTVNTSNSGVFLARLRNAGWMQRNPMISAFVGERMKAAEEASNYAEVLKLIRPQLEEATSKSISRFIPNGTAGASLGVTSNQIQEEPNVRN